MSPTPNSVRFGAFEANLHSGELRKNGVKLKLSEQPFQLLTILLHHPGQVVERQELRQQLWPADTFVDFEHGVNAAVKRLREVLEDSADNPRFIETLPRHGYRFICPVESLGTTAGEAVAKPGFRSSESPPPLRAGMLHWWRRPAIYLCLCLVLFVLGYATRSLLLSERPSVDLASVDFDILQPEGYSFVAEALSRSLIISPDASLIVFSSLGCK